MPPYSQSSPGTTASGPDAVPVPTLAGYNISKAFGPVTVLKSITLSFAAGEIHAIVGENGAGRSLQDLFPQKAYNRDEKNVLEVRNLSVRDHVTNASFGLKKGEILGFAGLIGAGRTELFEGVMGLRNISSGTIFKGGKQVKFSDYPHALRTLRAAYLPEDRKGKGLVVSFDALAPDSDILNSEF